MIIEVEARFNTRSKPSTKENKDGKVREMGKIYSTYYNNNKDPSPSWPKRKKRIPGAERHEAGVGINMPRAATKGLYKSIEFNSHDFRKINRCRAELSVGKRCFVYHHLWPDLPTED